MDLRSMQQQHRAALDKLRPLVKKESLTEAETKEADDLEKRAGDLKARIQREERFQALEVASFKQDKPWEKEKRKFSLKNALASLLGQSVDDGFEREVQKELETRGAPRQGDRSCLVPLDIFKPKTEKRIVDSTDAAELLQTTVFGAEYTPYLRQKSLLDSLGVRRIDASGAGMGKFNIPRMSTGVSSEYFTGDGGSTADDRITEADAAFDETSFEPHFLGIITSYSLRLLKEAVRVPNLIQVLQEDLAESIQEAQNKNFLSKTEDTNKKSVKGLFEQLTNNTALNVKDNSTANKQWTQARLEDVIKKLFVAYKGRLDNAKWLFAALDRELLRQKTFFTAQTTADFLWDKGSNMVCGFPAMATNLFSDKAIFGNFGECWIVTWGALELEMGTFGDQWARGTRSLRAILPWDIGVRRQAGLQKLTLSRA